jgi:DUF1680 family protein
MNERILTLLRVCLSDAIPIRRSVADLSTHLREAINWLCRAQDAGGGGGVARSYGLRSSRSFSTPGWVGAYPETTGYIIPTFFDYAVFAKEPIYRERAIRMAHWEVEVQMECGAVQGGIINFPPSPAVFNTGQVLFGWARAYQETGEEQFLSAAHRAGDFLVTVQDPDGAWRRGGSRYARPGVNLYDARTAWGLLEASQVTNDPRHREAALRNLDFACSKQHPNGWFPDCCLDDNERPLLHTLAYTAEGLVGAGLLLREPRYLTAARRTADALLARQRSDGSLAGLTGDAQIAIVWLHLFQETQEERYLQAAQRMNRFLMSTQDLHSKDLGVRGGIKGAHPIWGDYGAFEYLNWAAKFFADALLMEARV